MLTSVSRAAARRVLFARASSKLPQPLLAPQTLALRPAASARSFSVASSLHNPQAGAKKTAAAKKPAAKKPAAKKKPAVKKKPKAKKVKKAAPKPKKKPKKELTPEEKEKLLLRDLKKVALIREEPASLPASPWNIYIKDNLGSGTAGFGEKIEGISAAYKNLSSSELEALQTAAAANRITNSEQHSAWVRSHPLEVVYLANLARVRLNRMTKKRHARLADDRLPKRAQTGYSIFLTSRISDVDGSDQGSRFRAIAQEWKTLSDSEKAQYAERATVGMAQYKEELAALRPLATAYLKANGLKIRPSAM